MLEDVGAVREELARRRVERDRDVVAGAVARRLDRPRRASRAPPRSMAGRARTRPRRRPSVDRPRSWSVLLERVEDLGAHRSASAKRRRADGHDHELLEVDGVVGVGAAVEDVHHRHGQHVRGLAAQVALQRQPRLRRRGVRDGERDAEDRVGARGGTCSACRRGRSAPVEPGLVGGVARRARASAISPLTLATALRARPCRRSASSPSRSSIASSSPVEAPDGTAARPAAPERSAELDLDGRVAPAVEDLAGVDASRSGSWRPRPTGRPSPPAAPSRRARARSPSSSSDHVAPLRAASSSAPSTAARKRAEDARSASSGSTLSLRATLTTAKSRSPDGVEARVAVLARLAQRLRLAGDRVERVVGGRGVEAGRRRAALDLARVQQRREVLGHLAEDARLPPGLGALDRVPVAQHLGGVLGLRVPEHVRVAAHELVVDVLGDLGEVPGPALLEQRARGSGPGRGRRRARRGACASSPRSAASASS